ncbi:MAG TPA: DUF4136 domain-containing protein [Burkholderiaceae bacterium]
MKRYTAYLFAAAALLLSGCATTIRSDVLSQSAWPADLADKSFVFTQPQTDSIVYRASENLVRAQLHRIGLTDASGSAAKLHVSMDLAEAARDVRVITPVVIDPFWPGYGWHGPYRMGWRRGWWPYHPGYGAWGAMGYQESVSTVFQRRLHVTITQAGTDKVLYDVRVENTSRAADPMRVLPAMIVSGFEGFPGQSGVIRRVDVELKD